MDPELLKDIHSHLLELREAWERGCINESDGLGGTRSNRNVSLEVRLRKAMEEKPLNQGDLNAENENVRPRRVP